MTRTQVLNLMIRKEGARLLGPGSRLGLPGTGTRTREPGGGLAPPVPSSAAWAVSGVGAGRAVSQSRL